MLAVWKLQLTSYVLYDILPARGHNHARFTEIDRECYAAPCHSPTFTPLVSGSPRPSGPSAISASDSDSSGLTTNAPVSRETQAVVGKYLSSCFNDNVMPTPCQMTLWFPLAHSIRKGAFPVSFKASMTMVLF